MLVTVTATDPAVPANRRGVFVAEVGTLVAAVVVDIVLAIRLPQFTGLVPHLLTFVVPASGEATAALAVLRRRFPDRVLLLGLVIAGLSAGSTLASAAIAIAGQGTIAYPGTTEIVAMALVTGAACRRLSGRGAATVALACVAAMVATPLVRYGIGSPVALLAVPAALLWGAALAVGLILRDADTRRLADLAAVRESERRQLARELHDLIAHHVSGIVVRAQAAKATAANPNAAAQDPAQVYADIEQAGAQALAATRQLVGMLRADGPIAVLPGSALGEAVRAAVAAHGGTDGAVDGRLDVDIDPELDTAPAPPDLSITAHRLVQEALTNVRRHARDVTRISVRAAVDGPDVVLDIHDDGTGARPHHRGHGYGLIGMTERVAALGGTLRAGPDRGGGWRLTARLRLQRTEPVQHSPKDSSR